MDDRDRKIDVRRAAVRDVAVLAVGFGCLIGYARMASLGFGGYLTQGFADSGDAWYVLRAVSGLVAFAVLAAAGAFKWFRISVPVLLVAMAAAVAAPIVFAVDAEGGLGAVVAVLSGLSSAVLMYAWMLLLSRFDVRSIVVATLAGLCLAGLVIVGAPRIEAALGLVVAVAAAFVAGACALIADPRLMLCAPDGRLSKSEAARIPWLTVVMVLACGFLSTAVYGVAEHLTLLYAWSPNYAVFGVAAAVVVIATAGLVARHRNWVHLAWVPLFSLLVVALAFSCVSLRESIQVAFSLMLAAVFCAHFLYWMVFPALFSMLRVPRAFLVGVVLFVANGSLAVMAGDALGATLPKSMQNLGGIAGLAILTLAVLALVTFLAYRRAFGTVGLFGGASPVTGGGGLAFGASSEAPALRRRDGNGSEGDAAESADALAASAGEEGASGEGAGELAEGRDGHNPIDVLKGRMDRYADEFGLTPRETEVALLTVQGFSCAYIAEKLVVSNSTVRFHQQNLYRKFDVHSRNELIERVTEA